MLQRVMHEMQAAQGTIRLDELASRVGMEPSALKGMIDFWVNKGRLRLVGDDDQATASCTGSCGGSCPGAAACPFVAKMPTMYAVQPKPKQVDRIELSTIL